MLSINQFIPVNQAATTSSTLQSTFRKHLAVINEWWYCWCFRNSAITTCYLWNPYETCDILHINWWTPDVFHQPQRIYVWYIPENPNDLYFRRSTPQNKAEIPTKTRVIWVPGIYLHLGDFLWWILWEPYFSLANYQLFFNSPSCPKVPASAEFAWRFLSFFPPMTKLEMAAIDTIREISSDHQLSLVVYPMIYKVLYISGGCFSPDFWEPSVGPP